jgi:hypothetical protein
MGLGQATACHLSAACSLSSEPVATGCGVVHSAVFGAEQFENATMWDGDGLADIWAEVSW